MAKDVEVLEFYVQPVEDKDGNLEGLSIQPTVRKKRVSDDGKMLSYGVTEDRGEALVVPAGHIADLARELVDWPVYYAVGQASEDRRG